MHESVIYPIDTSGLSDIGSVIVVCLFVPVIIYAIIVLIQETWF